MKKIIITLFVIALASCSNNGWEKSSESEVGFTHTVAGFIDDSNGITAGYSGEVHFTNDGGKQWPKAENRTMCRFALDALESGDLIHAGNGGTVAFSDDGKSWTKLETPISGKALLVNFYDKTYGSVVNQSGEIKTTADGGKSWFDIAKPESAIIIIAIEQFSQHGICIIEKNGYIHITNDLGAKLESRKIPVKENNIEINKLSFNSASMRFSDSNNGTIAIIAPAADQKKSKIIVLRTGDGAKSFIKEKISCELNSSTTVFLSPDSTYLTVNGLKKIELFRHI